MVISINSPVARLFVVSALAFMSSCAKFNALKDTRIHIGNESCHLGDVLVGVTDKDKDVPVRCVPYKPALNHTGCKEWSEPQHRKLMDSILLSNGTMTNRINALDATLKPLAHIQTEGHVRLMSSSLGVSSGVVIPIKIAAQAENLDLVVELSGAYVMLELDQLNCYQEQTTEDITKFVSIDANRKEKILGFISKADIGFANYLHLTDVSIDLSYPKYVELKARHFNVSVTVQGTMDSSYRDKLRNLLNSISGKEATIVSNELAAFVPGIERPATTFVEVTRFAKSP